MTPAESWLAERDARIKADAIAQERAAWVAKIEALADRWAGLGEGPFAPDAPITLMNAVKAKQLRALLSSDATAALDTVREQAKAEALREAADAIWAGEGGYVGGVQWGRADYVGWLRARAADTEAGR